MKRSAAIALSLFLAVLALALLTGREGIPGAVAQTDIVPGEVLVKFRPGTPGQAIADAHRQNSGRVKEEIPGIGVQVVQVPPGQERARAAAYARNPNVLYACLLYTSPSPRDS